MIRTGFTFEVFAEIEFTAQEVALLMACSEFHYDFKCRGLSQPGGLLYMLVLGQTATWTLSSRDLDTLCKVVENPPERTEFWKRFEHDLHDQRRAVAAKRRELETS